MPLISRYVGASATASNCSDALTTPGTWVASSLSVPRCVVATVIVPRAVSSSRIAQPSAAPSIGSVPEPSSSMSTSESAVASRRISARFFRCALNVDRLASIDCSSPTSANTSSNTAMRLSGPDRRGDARLRHRRDQSERLEQHRLAAGVRAGDEQRALVRRPSRDRTARRRRPARAAAGAGRC